MAWQAKAERLLSFASFGAVINPPFQKSFICVLEIKNNLFNHHFKFYVK